MAEPIKQDPIVCHPYNADLIQVLARQVIHEHLEKLPLLTDVIILLPHYQVTSRLRKQLIMHAQEQGFNSISGPRIYTLKDFILKNTLLERPQLSANSAELLLIKSLQEH